METIVVTLAVFLLYKEKKNIHHTIRQKYVCAYITLHTRALVIKCTKAKAD